MSSRGSFVADIVQDLTSPHGQFRLFVQPIVSAFVGARLGVADSHEGRHPFVVRLLHTKDRSLLMKQSLSDVVFPLCVAMIIDAIVQYFTLGYVRPVAAVFVGMLLVWLPYAAARGLANRIRSRYHRHAPA